QHLVAIEKTEEREDDQQPDHERTLPEWRKGPLRLAGLHEQCFLALGNGYEGSPTSATLPMSARGDKTSQEAQGHKRETQASAGLACVWRWSGDLCAAAYSSSLTGSRSSRMYIGRPLPLLNVCDGSMPIAW